MTDGPTRDPAPQVVLHEERLQVTHDRVPTERLLLTRVITSETRQVEVTVRREELRVSRLAADGTAARETAGEPLVIVLSEEVPVVQLHTRPYERVTVHVDSVTTQQAITEQLSRERAEVQDLSGRDLG